MSQITKPVILDETGQSIATQVEAVVTALENLDTFSGNYADLEGLPTLGTASALDVAASGNASSSQVVKGNDTRLTDARPSSDVVQTYNASSQVPISGKGVAEAIDTVVPTKEATSETGSNVIELFDAAVAPLVKCVTAITGYQEGSGTPSPDNIRPIVAYTEGEIEVRGKNIFNIDPSAIVEGSSIASVSGNTVRNTSTSAWASVRYQLTLPAGTYTASIGTLTQTSSGATIQFATYSGGSYTQLVALTTSNEHGTFTLSAQATVRVSLYSSASNNPFTIAEIQIEKGSTATAYDPYEGTTHTTTFPSAIYRGSEDCVNGEVTTEKKKMILNGSASETYVHNTGWVDGAYIMTNALADAVQVSGYTTIADLICNQAEAKQPSLIVNGNYGIGQGEGSSLYIYLGAEYDTEAKLKTYLANNPLEIVYDLATPTTSSVTPTNLPIKSLSGYTHIESSTGDMEVEYISGNYQALVDLIGDEKVKQENYTSTSQAGEGFTLLFSKDNTDATTTDSVYKHKGLEAQIGPGAGSQILVMDAGCAYSNTLNAAVVGNSRISVCGRDSVSDPMKQVSIDNDDIYCSTKWDGKNTYLKDALAVPYGMIHCCVTSGTDTFELCDVPSDIGDYPLGYWPVTLNFFMTYTAQSATQYAVGSYYSAVTYSSGTWGSQKLFGLNTDGSFVNAIYPELYVDNGKVKLRIHNGDGPSDVQGTVSVMLGRQI